VKTLTRSNQECILVDSRGKRIDMIRHSNI